MKKLLKVLLIILIIGTIINIFGGNDSDSQTEKNIKNDIENLLSNDLKTGKGYAISVNTIEDDLYRIELLLPFEKDSDESEKLLQDIYNQIKGLDIKTINEIQIFSLMNGEKVNVLSEPNNPDLKKSILEDREKNRIKEELRLQTFPIIPDLYKSDFDMELNRLQEGGYEVSIEIPMEAEPDVCLPELNRILEEVKKINIDKINKISIYSSKDSKRNCVVTYPRDIALENSVESNYIKHREAIAKEEHDKWINDQFSVWDGSHRELTKLIKQNLNDEKSYDHIKTVYVEILNDAQIKEMNKLFKQVGSNARADIGDLWIETQFSAKNAFNATIKSKAYGFVDKSTNTVYLLDIE